MKYRVIRLFSLVELLVVIAILAALISLLSPSLQSMQYSAKSTLCMNNLKNLTMGTTFFCEDNNGQYPNMFDTTDAVPSKNGMNEPLKGDCKSVKMFYAISGYRGSWDIRKPLRPYFGGQCGDDFICPLYNGGIGDLSKGMESFDDPLTRGNYYTQKMTYAIFPHLFRDKANFESPSLHREGDRNNKNWIVLSANKFESDLMWGDCVNLKSGGTMVKYTGSDWANEGGRTPPTMHIRPTTTLYQKGDYTIAFEAEGNYSYKDGSVIPQKYDFPITDVSDFGLSQNHNDRYLIFPKK